MNKPKLLALICVVPASLALVSCAAPPNRMPTGAQVLMVNDNLIRFSYLLNSDALTPIQNYAEKHCADIGKQAKRGTRTCDAEKCEIAYFCEG